MTFQGLCICGGRSR